MNCATKLFGVVNRQGPVKSLEIKDTIPDDIRSSVLENIKRWERSEKRLGLIPSGEVSSSYSNGMAETFSGLLKDRMVVLSWYESAIERAMMKALDELQKLQAARINGAMFAPIAVDVEINS